MKIGLEKLENYEGIAVKALLDSRITDLFMDMTFSKEKGFRIEKLKNPLLIKNVNRIVNVGGAITYQVKCNMFFKEYIERARIDVCNIGKTEVILGMLQLAAYNPEIDQEKAKVKMTQCSPICGKRKQEIKGKVVKRTERDKDTDILRKLVSKKFWKWKKVFGKKNLERMLVQKTQNYTIELKKGFVLRKEKVYLLSREEREEIQAFVEDQLRKEYIQLSKSSQILLVYFVAKKDGT